MKSDLQMIILLIIVLIINLSSFIVLTYPDIKNIYTHWRRDNSKKAKLINKKS